MTIKTTADPSIQSILDIALDGRDVNREQALRLLRVDERSPDMYAIMSAANTLTRRQYENRGEVYGTVGINAWPCPKSCAFCSFGADWNLIDSPVELTCDEVAARARSLEDEGANAIFLMTTADYPFDRFLRAARAVRSNVSAKMPLVANIGDFESDMAKELVDAGFQAIYHVHRLGEGKDTRIRPDLRLKTIRAAQNVGLDLSYCVEPIGPEHSPEQLIAEMFRGRELGAVNLACMWRVPVPGLPISKLGKISEATLAKIVAITRIVGGYTTRAMGVHEPRKLPLFSGANQIYAQTAGFSPRRPQAKKHESASERKGYSVRECRDLLREAGFVPLDGPTKVFQGNW